MAKQSKEMIMKPVAAAVGVAFISSLAVASATAAENPFNAEDLDAGYMLAGGDKGEEGKCGGDKEGEEGKCGEGKCGGDKEGEEGKCGEGKCGGDKEGEEGKCGEGKCGGDKDGEEGKCGGAA